MRDGRRIEFVKSCNVCGTYFPWSAREVCYVHLIWLQEGWDDEEDTKPGVEPLIRFPPGLTLQSTVKPGS